MIVGFCYFLFYIVEALIFYQYCSALFTSRYSGAFRLIVLVLSYGVLSLISGLGNPVVNLLGFTAVNVLFLRLVCSTRLPAAMFHSIISTAVMSVSEMIVIAAAPFPAVYYFTNWSTFQLWLIPSIISKLVYFLVMHLLAHFSRWQDKKDTPFDRMLLILIALPLVSVFIMYTFLLLCGRYTLDFSLNLMITACSVFLLALNIIIWVLYRYNRDRTRELSEAQLSLQKENDLLTYYRMLIDQDEEQRRFIHDVKKHLQSIALLNEQRNPEKVASYIGTLTESSILKTSSRICSNDFLNAVLCRYASLCMEQDISFRTDIRKDAVDFMSENDMTSLFCNLLDNAMAAALSMPEPFIELSASHQEHTSFTVLTVINSCRNDPFGSDTQKSSRTRPGHGYGLKIISRIIRVYDGEMQCYYAEESHTYHTIVTLKTVQDSTSHLPRGTYEK